MQALAWLCLSAGCEPADIRVRKRIFFPLSQATRALSVHSVVDVHTWDQARWKATAYAEFAPHILPCIAFVFENREGARKIFERWRERFGKQDANEEIYLAIIRHLLQQNPHHYTVLVTSKYQEAGDFKPSQTLVVTTRSMTMEPDNDVNLERFLESYLQFGAFYLMPAVLTDKGTPELLPDLSILKHDLSVKEAADVGEHDIEAVALRRTPQ